ncbi:TPA: 1-acyl-sn-glycerol-3-phosphate acyltransferase, partial [Acinetobacter baumannii]|nr:1-acyl-sn-glycerol-3-phosphate acyltransferase [Acinetobacter baumannii]
EIIPVWIANLNRVMPKGAFLPLPLLSTVTFGQPLKVQVIKKNEFIEQARNKLLELNGEEYK